MADDLGEKVTRNTIDIEVLKNTSMDTCKGIDKICQTMDEDRKQNRKSFDNIDQLLRGKDSENPGLCTRMDRLENFSKRVKAAIGSLITATIAIAATVLSWILGVFGKGD